MTPSTLKVSQFVCSMSFARRKFATLGARKKVLLPATCKIELYNLQQIDEKVGTAGGVPPAGTKEERGDQLCMGSMALSLRTKWCSCAHKTSIHVADYCDTANIKPALLCLHQVRRPLVHLTPTSKEATGQFSHLEEETLW